MNEKFICRFREHLQLKLKRISQVLQGCNSPGSDDGYVSDIKTRCNSFSGQCYDIRYKIYKCPKCRQKLRVPRGKGKIRISCRRCQYEFIRKT